MENTITHEMLTNAKKDCCEEKPHSHLIEHSVQEKDLDFMGSIHGKVQLHWHYFIYLHMCNKLYALYIYNLTYIGKKHKDHYNVINKEVNLTGHEEILLWKVQIERFGSRCS